MNRRGFLGALWTVPLAASIPNVLAGVEVGNAYPTTITFSQMVHEAIRANGPAMIENLRRNNALLARLSAGAKEF